ncbi:divergent PAP2 family protein [Alkalibacterium kapii]|uniref:Membrane protein n=1 Tax=Alkalibacterium kapii TaxID=426704 RepID=A0A511AVF4_9LACT|nr:divergent PAP2 family protein [Alkalibacterium kapii]GEK92124.1 membrane protein [Alkalibacterium kapii]
MQLLENFPLIAALSAIILSQIIKIPVAYFLRRPSTIALAISTGGMPSSHSAGVTALITSLLIEYGVQSPFVAIAFTFGIIVIFDSMGVRRQSGEHGIIINELIRDFDDLRKAFSKYHHEEVLKEDDEELRSRGFLGHKPIEVFFGIISGIIIALIISLFY